MVLAYYDGHYVDKKTITVSPLDFGFSRGVALYEFLRLYDGVPFRMEDHLDRLAQGAAALGVACPAKSDIAAIVRRLAADSHFPHSTITFFLTAGECDWSAGPGFNECKDFKPHFMAMITEVHPLSAEAPNGIELYRRGLNVETVPFNREMPLVKSTNYARGFAAIRALKDKGCDDILYTHADGYITEASRSNFFCVIDGKLCTPRQGMLYGVTRKVLLELAGSCGVTAVEADITIDDLRRATEAFISGSYIELLPLSRLNDISFATTMEGPVFSKLRRAFTGVIEQSTRLRAA